MKKKKKKKLPENSNITTRQHVHSTEILIDQNDINFYIFHKTKRKKKKEEDKLIEEEKNKKKKRKMLPPFSELGVGGMGKQSVIRIP